MLKTLIHRSIVSRHFSGSIRSAGGAMGKRGEVHEEEYFHKQRQEQLRKLKLKKITEKEFVEERMKKHQEAIEFHKRMIDEYKTGERLKEDKKEVHLQ